MSENGEIYTAVKNFTLPPSDGSRGRRSVLKIHFFIESDLKMIQFKTKSKIFIQKNIHPEYIQKNYSFKKINNSAQSCSHWTSCDGQNGHNVPKTDKKDQFGPY